MALLASWRAGAAARRLVPLVFPTAVRAASAPRAQARPQQTPAVARRPAHLRAPRELAALSEAAALEPRAALQPLDKAALQAPTQTAAVPRPVRLRTARPAPAARPERRLCRTPQRR